MRFPTSPSLRRRMDLLSWCKFVVVVRCFFRLVELVVVGFCWQDDDLVFERTLIYTVDSMCIFDLLVATVFNFFCQQND